MESSDSQRGEVHFSEFSDNLCGERYYIFLRALVRRNDQFACHLLKNSTVCHCGTTVANARIF